MALKESQADEQRSRDESIARLQAEYDRGQSRLDAMYLDKLDGRIEVAYFDRKATEWRRDLDALAASIREHRSADRSYVDGGVRLLELAAHAHELFVSQAPGEKRKLLNFVVADASWSGGHLTATLRQPFSLISELAPRADSGSTGTQRVDETASSSAGVISPLSNRREETSGNSKTDAEETDFFRSANWLPLVEAYRTLLISPDAGMLALLDGRGIGFDSP